MTLLRQKKSAVPNAATTPPPDDPLASSAMVSALADLDAHLADLAAFRATIAGWKTELEDFIANGDPTDDRRAIAASALKTRIEMAPNHLARAEENTPAFMEAVVTEIRAFEGRLMATGPAEIARLDAAIVPALRAFCESEAAALSVARACPVYGFIPVDRRSSFLGVNIQAGDAFWNAGHEGYPFADVLERQGKGHVDAMLRVRIADLLNAYKAWQERGGRWVPADFAASAPAPVANAQ